MTCIVVDDEPLAREYLGMLVAEREELELIGSFNSATSALDFLARQTPDLLFLDIRMPGIDGMTLARSLSPKIKIVFTTAHPEHAPESYEVEAVDYLLKPVKQDRFHQAVQRAALLLPPTPTSPLPPSPAHQENFFFVRSDHKVLRIEVDELLLIEGLKDYVILHTASQKIFTAMNLKTICDQLPQNTFFRISKSFVVNIQKIRSIENNAVLIGSHEIPIGNTYRTLFFQQCIHSKMLGRR